MKQSLVETVGRIVARRSGRALREPRHGLLRNVGARYARPDLRQITIVSAITLLASIGAASAAGDSVKGQKKFEECAACHALDKAAADNVGPSLYGVFQRKAAQTEDFKYSPAMRRSGIVWTAETLDTFLADPQAAVPANRMPYAGMPNPADRADLIAYLQQAFK